MGFTHSCNQRQVLFKGQYYHFRELSKIYNIPLNTLCSRYQRGDRDDRLVRPPNQKYIGNYIKERMDKKKEQDGEIVYSTDTYSAGTMTDDINTVVKNFMTEYNSIEIEPEHIDMGASNQEGGFDYHG